MCFQRYASCLLMFALGVAVPAIGRASWLWNKATEITQHLNWEILDDNTRRMILKLYELEKQWRNWGNLPFGNGGQDLRALNGLVQLVGQSMALGYNAQNLTDQYNQRYGDYQTYQGEAFAEPDMARKYQQWSAETHDDALTALKVAHLQMQDFDTEEDTIKALENLTGSAAGQMQAIQVRNALDLQLVRQLQKFRQLLMMSIQMEADAMAAEQDEQVLKRTEATRMVTPVVDFQPQQGPRY